ncbi:MAG: HD domain-containing protein [Butyrivibrio sp.]|nr:HD domain-containing protein [Butyrivibrio sp.]
MVTTIYGAMLLFSVAILIFMAHKNYENIDIHYWTIVMLVPIIILGYWLKTRVTTPEGAILAFCYIYLDSTVLLTVIIFCILHFMGIEPKPWIKVIAYSTAFGHMGMIWLCVDNDLYYKSIKLVDTGMGIATKMVSGPLKIVHWIYLAGIFSAIIGLIALAYFKNGTYSRRTLYLYTTLLGIGLIIYVIETFIDVDFSSLPILYVMSDLMIAVNYDHAHTHDISCIISEQQKYHGTRGYMAFDLDGRYLSCNEKMYEFIPELSKQIVDAKIREDNEYKDIIYGLIEEYKKNKTNYKNFNIGDMICQCEISEFTIRKDGKIQGYLFDVRDVTEEQKVLQVMQDYNETLNTEVAKKTENIKRIQERVVLGLANMVENRDNNTGGHVKRTSDIIHIIVDEMRKQGVYNMDDVFASDIIRAAPMHDLGKIIVENSILCKPAKLTDEEFAIMKKHPIKSGEFVNIILKNVEEKHFVDVAFNVARFHHERWDGRGYPEGLVGEMIPLEARIMAVADVYDALVSKRCYKEPMSFDKAASIMVEGMGSQFDPNMLSVFLGCRDELEKYYSVEDSNEANTVA